MGNIEGSVESKGVQLEVENEVKSIVSNEVKSVVSKEVKTAATSVAEILANWMDRLQSGIGKDIQKIFQNQKVHLK